MTLDSNLYGPYSPPGTHLVDRLRYWAEQTPTNLAFFFIVDGDQEELQLTYEQLDRKVRSVAATLTDMGMQGERVLLLYPPGLDFVTGFLGCLYAGAIAVPAYPPRRNRNMVRIQAISDDANAKAALTVEEVVQRTQGLLDEAPHLKKLQWLATDGIDEKIADRWRMPEIGADKLAVLQYTSGSTGMPKGVMLTHANLMHNASIITYSFEPSAIASGISWLPTYHDMGLVGGLIQPLYIGRPSGLISPMAFLQKPVRWLRAISKHRTTISGGPNFAYQLCNDKITPEECEGLDLSCWDVAFNGAEPLRAETLVTFTEKFSPYGFQSRAHFACYGMAETTLIITGSVKHNLPVVRTFDGDAIDQHRVVTLAKGEPRSRQMVGCGRVLPDEIVRIVDPGTLRETPADRIGEVWVCSPSVGKGYRNRPEETKKIFQARLVGSDEGPFLRTGDLGFVAEGELFITGRLKDLIIVRGVNRYPQDIENTVEHAHKYIRNTGAAAFAADLKGRERLIIVSETERVRNKDWDEVIDHVRRAVTAEHDLPPDVIVLVRSGSITKTSSGKIQRKACRDLYLSGGLSIVAQWNAWDDTTTQDKTATPKSITADRNKEAESDVDPNVIEIVMDHIREIAQERAKNLSADTNITIDLGLDSLERMQIANALEETFGGRFPEEVLQQIETVREVAAALVKHIGSEPKIRREVASPGQDAGKRPDAEIQPVYYQFDKFPEVIRLKQTHRLLLSTGADNPFFKVHEGLTSDTTTINGKEYLNFSSFNYLGMSGDPIVAQAAKDAIDRFGTSVSASRLVSGEKTINQELDREIAQLLGTDDAITFIGGHTTNESTIGHLFGPGDLILHDSLAHNSIIKGAELSGARRRAFQHNDWRDLDQVLKEIRHDYRRVLIAIEGVYSMDGDYPDLPQFIEVKKRHKAFILVDEAHSLGTMGSHGRGLGEFYELPADDVDLWMGTMSKSLGSSGGYVAGGKQLIEFLKYTTPGYVFATGISPAATAAALASIRLMQEQPERVASLQANSKLFLELAKAAGLNTGMSDNTPVIPLITGSSLMALQLSGNLFKRGVNAMPILHPAVEEEAARVRFFITSLHTEAQIRQTVTTTVEEYAKLNPNFRDVGNTQDAKSADSLPHQTA